MPTLAETLRANFPSEVRRRGLAYYEGGRVQVIHQRDDSLEATVMGTRRYRVTLELLPDAGGVFTTCSCPFAALGSSTCKHVWALVQAADKLGFGNGYTPSEIDPAASPEPRDDLWDDGEADTWQSAGLPDYPEPGVQFRTHNWRQALESIAARPTDPHPKLWPAQRQVLYLVQPQVSAQAGTLVIALRSREPRQKGGWNRARRLQLAVDDLDCLPDPQDRDLLSALCGAGAYMYWGQTRQAVAETYRLTKHQIRHLLPRMIATGRCLMDDGELAASWRTLHLDADPTPWTFEVQVAPAGRAYRVFSQLRRGEESRALEQASLCLAATWVIWPDGCVAPLACDADFSWLAFFRTQRELSVPSGDAEKLLATLFAKTNLPTLKLPDALQVREHVVAPRPCLRLRVCGTTTRPAQGTFAALEFDYGGRRVNPHGAQASALFLEAGERMVLRRDPITEQEARAALGAAGFEHMPFAPNPEAPFTIGDTRLGAAILKLIDQGWHVEAAAGKPYRRAGDMAVSVSSGLDWFDVQVSLRFDGVAADMPTLLAAVRKRERSVVLSDGSVGVLSDELMRKLAPILGMGDATGERVRYRRNQAGVLEALLAAQPDATCDETFRKVREELGAFDAIAAADPPPGFQGELRPYQRDGLGWMAFLRRFGLGGCLADDMGLGKTVQVLALLEGRRQARAAGDRAVTAPSLVVVPRSLVFNWKQEAMRFAPQLRILDHTGITRSKHVGRFEACDVVLTTYGTLRNDIVHLQGLTFDYLVLDEAQAIKNAGAQTAKATRLLRGQHRLALSGTPVQNHLGELWSLFEFLNPGMLGASSAFSITDLAGRESDPAVRMILARILRPFILRRTKSEVAKDLPARVEETVYCEMEPKQRRDYDELKAFYQQSLLARVDRDGMGKSRMHVLEALLRLRQAACHPGLLNPERLADGSAKLDVLIDQLLEVTEEGHKALVFSQFTSFLAIVRQRLDTRGLRYAYLDGRTRDRQAPVAEFQEDPDVKLFLISLKAGGLGLNLTAAEYVFLLDPWWNPAVEAQAVDRAHRIGQTRQVFAYRLIAKDTVEEKVLELQQTKRDLADSIITADNGLIRKLSREDLARLLG